MKLKRLPALPLFLTLMTLPLHAATISFLVIETGLTGDLGANEYSILWESSLLDVFYEEGHIVSNSPILRLAEKPEKEFPDEAMVDLSEASAGGADYFILAMVDYPSPVGGRNQKPGNISLRLYKTRPYQFLYEERYAGGKNNNMNNELVLVKQTVRRLIPHLKG